MKILARMILAMALIISLFPIACLAGETLQIYPDKFYIFSFGTYSPFEKDVEEFEGITFPVYVGYAIIKESEVLFKKKTKLPFPDIVKFFKSANDNGYITTPPSGRAYEQENIEFSDMRFGGMLHESLNYYAGHPILIWQFVGEPDENYVPEFNELCNYNYKNKIYCQARDFIYYSDDILIPTSNAVKYRVTSDVNTRLFYIEKYDMNNNKWEKIGEYKKLRENLNLTNQ